MLGDLAQDRPKPVVEIEGAGGAEGDLALEAIELRQALPPLRGRARMRSQPLLELRLIPRGRRGARQSGQRQQRESADEEEVGVERRGGVAGLEAVLGALVARRVDTLLVSEGFEAPGWRCPGCAWVGTRGRRCPLCASDMERVDDVVEEAVEEALAQACRVSVCRDNADLDVLGRIGALLRH